MKPKISIIVPIYNTEKYLDKSIQSLINQTFKDIEIILVNDGSTDNSRNICEYFKIKDKRIKVINKENGGPGSARNKGIEIANGEYIAFMDSDDYVEVDMYETMYNRINEYNCDIVVCQVNMVDEQGNIVLAKDNKNVNGNIEHGEDAIKRYLKYGRWGPCDKLYKRELFENVNFIEGITCEEDNIVIIPILSKATKIVTIDNYFYNYVIRHNSTTNSKFSIKNFDSIYVWESVLEQSRYMGDDILNLAEARLFRAYVHLINGVIKNKAYDFNDEINIIIDKLKTEYKKIYKNNQLNIIYKIIGYMIIKNLPLYEKIFTLFLYIRKKLK